MKKLYSLLIVFTLVFSLTGCMENDEVKPDVDTEDKVDTKEDKVKELNTKALSDIKKEEFKTKDKIKEATEYINNNVNMVIKTDAINEKLIYYSAYLKHMGEDNKEHNLTKLGDKTYTYITNIYTKKDTENSDSSNKLKTDITNHIDTFKNEVDKNVEEFHNLIKS